MPLPNESWGSWLLTAATNRCPNHTFAVDVSRDITVTYVDLLLFTISFQELVKRKLSTEHPETSVKRERGADAPSVPSPVVESPLVAIVCNEGLVLALAESCCLLSGIPFLPLNPKDPIPRRHMLSTQFNAECEVTEQELWELLTANQGRACVASSLPSWESVINVSIPDSYVAYVITTSGSTGLPKGVVAERGNLRAYVEQFSSVHSSFTGMNRAKLQTPTSPSCGPDMSWKEGCLGLQISESSRVLLLSSCTFDPSIGDIANCLHIGSLLLCAQRSDIEERLWDVLRAAKPTHVISTPALWQTIHLPSSLRTTQAPTAWSDDWLPDCKVFLGGEVMPRGLISEWANRVQLFNIYGVTEVTIYQCIQRVFPGPEDERRGMLNTEGKLAAGQAVNLDVFCETDALGLLRHCDSASGGGEIVLVGDQVCRGYFDELSLVGASASLRRKVFFAHQRRPAYRTGDVGVVVTDSCQLTTLWLGGRSDFQIKLNGQRVSLEECDQGVLDSLGSFGGCVRTAVIPKKWSTAGDECSSDMRIGAMCALRVADDFPRRADLWGDALAIAAKKTMPTHMVPSLWLTVFQTLSNSASLPITSSGKVDRSAVRVKLLAELERQSCAVNCAQDEHLTDMERLVAKEWSKLFGIRVRPNSDFFRLGGDSLSALKIVRAVYFAVTQHSEGEGDIDAHGNMPSLFSPKHLLTHSRLREYASFIEDGLRQEKDAVTTMGNEAAGAVHSQENSTIDDTSVVDLLMEATSGGDGDLVRFLLERSLCAVDGRYTRDFAATTPLHIAISQQDAAMTVLLLDLGAKVTAVNGDGVSPAHLAAMLPTADFLRLLASRGVPMTVRDARQQSLLHSAARFGSVPCCAFLLSITDTDPTIRDCWQRTALHWAVLNNHMDTVKCLTQVTHVKDQRTKPRLYRGGVSSKNRSDRLARRRTHLQYESVSELACRLYGDTSEMALLCHEFVD